MQLSCTQQEIFPVHRKASRLYLTSDFAHESQLRQSYLHIPDRFIPCLYRGPDRYGGFIATLDFQHVGRRQPVGLEGCPVGRGETYDLTAAHSSSFLTLNVLQGYPSLSRWQNQ